MEKEYLSPTEAAKILKISHQAVIDRIKHGTLFAERAGRQYIIPKNQLLSKKISKEMKKATGIKVSKAVRVEKIATKDVLKKVDSFGIKTIQLWFVDILGILKCVSITPGELKEALAYVKGFDGSSVSGFA